MSAGDGTHRERMRAALSVAIKARDRIAVSALRSALGAIDNAEAIEIVEVARFTDDTSPIAGATSGLGATEALRRELTDADVGAILAGEIAERTAAADEYEAAGRGDAAETLRAEATVLAAHLR